MDLDAGFAGAFAKALTAIAPFFGIVFLGWFAARRKLITQPEIIGLNRFVFLFALPPLLFRAMSRAPEASSAAVSYVVIWGAATLALYIVARLVGRVVYGLRRGEDALFAHCGVNGNVGFLGLPLALATLGPEGGLPTAIALTFDTLVIVTITMVSLETNTGRGGVGAAIARSLSHPILLGSIGGFLWGLLGRGSGLTLPGPIATFMDTLGGAATPAALFAVGAMLAQTEGDRRLKELGGIAVIKLVLYPVTIIVAFTLIAPALGVTEIAPLWFAAAALAAACPSSNNGAVFAATYGVYHARAAAAVLVTSILCVPIYTALVAALAPG